MLASFILLLHVIFHSTLSLFVYSACSIEYIDCSTAIYLIFLINLQNYSFLLQPLWYLYCINNNLIFYALNVNFNIIILFASNFQNLFSCYLVILSLRNLLFFSPHLFLPSDFSLSGYSPSSVTFLPNLSLTFIYFNTTYNFYLFRFTINIHLTFNFY